MEITPDEVDPNLDKKLVHMSGDATTSETLIDPEFKLALNATALERKVEMYQWKEERASSAGSDGNQYDYRYSKVWDTEVIPSANFKESRTHKNPTSMRFAAHHTRAKNVTIGAFSLSNSLISSISDDKTHPIDDAFYKALPSELQRTLTSRVTSSIMERPLAHQPSVTPASPSKSWDRRIRSAS